MKKILFTFLLLALAASTFSQIVIQSPANANPASQSGVSFYQMIVPVCQTYTVVDCINASGTGTSFFISSADPQQGSVVVAPTANPSPLCFEYTAPTTFIGVDSVTFTIENDLLETATVVVAFRVIKPTVAAQPFMLLHGETEADLIANSPHPDATYSWQLLTGDAIIADPTSANTTISGLEQGGYLLRWNQLFPCGEVRSAYKVIYVLPGNSGLDSDVIHFAADSLNFPEGCSVDMAVMDVSSDCGGPYELLASSDTLSHEFCKLNSALGANACAYPYPWSFAMFGVPGAEKWYLPQTLGYRTYDNGTLHIYGNVANAQNTNAIWKIDVWLYDERTWDEWSTQDFPTSYKADCNGLSANHVDWSYYKLGYGVATGQGDLLGSYLNFTQAPDNYYFGFQLGVGANNLNPEYGLGGWLAYQGFLQNAATGFSSNVSGAADIAGISSCCQSLEVETTYQVTDGCNQTAIATQIVDTRDVTGPVVTNELPDGQLLCSAGFTPWISSWIDNCSTVSVVDNSVFVGSDYHYLQIATDDCGNSTTIDILQSLYTGDCSELGCTDPGACNYSPLATIDDGSCYVLTANAGEDVVICTGETVELTGQYDPIFLNDVAYLWTPTESISGNGQQGVIANPDFTTVYTLTVSDPNGCMATDDVMVIVNGACIPGCMDPEANNYDPLAQIDNGSCTYMTGILIFNDENGDGIRQTGEPGIPYWPVEIAGSQAVIYSNMFGFVNMPFPAGDYTINLINNSSVWTSTTPITISITLPDDVHGKFGLIASGTANSEAEVYQGFYDVIQCTNGFDGGVHVINTGASVLTGLITLTCDNMFIPGYDGFSTIGPDLFSTGYAEWNIDDFTPGSSSLFSFHIDSPGLDYLGSFFDFTMTVELYNELNELVYTNSWTVSREVTCAYDPNDLTANPVGWYDPHYILPGQRIDFRVRFENIGNAPAEDVVVMDAIDANVYDLSTFEPMYASHPVTICLHDDGMVDLIFENINLPGSEQNSEQSHGFGVFRIAAREDLTHGTVLTNDASIFFDQNPAINTNEVFHTIFDCNSFEGISGNNEVCVGDVVTLSASQDYVESYSWSVDGTDAGVNEDAAFVDLGTGEHEVQVILGNPLCVTPLTATVVVYDFPVTDINQNGSQLTAVDGSAWQWYHNDEIIPGATTQSITVTETGAYYVMITGAGDCQVQSETLLITDVSDLGKRGIVVYPNPFTVQTTVVLPTGTFDVVLYDMTGQVVMQTTNCSGRMIIDRSNLNVGAYRLTARSNSAYYAATLILN